MLFLVFYLRQVSGAGSQIVGVAEREIALEGQGAA
jgi:hypothetical protein